MTTPAHFWNAFGNLSLRKALQSAKGIYLFYDSRDRALYAGQAKQQVPWREMKSAFNTQKLNIVTLGIDPKSTFPK